MIDAKLHFSRHALSRMFERSISVDDVRALLEAGEPIEEYPEDTPRPSLLLLAVVGERPLHAVVAETEPGVWYVITVYEPDPERWEAGFRTRRTR